jgi:hypothetical protein
VPIHKSVKSAWALSGVSNSRMRIFVQDTEIKLLRGDVACCLAQARAPIDAEIGQKDHSWMETNLDIDLTLPYALIMTTMRMLF